ncbi:MAG: ATP synthase F1 subunit gamma [Clostridia bacterium]|nr:ATP synthase F1 subunit gamma [Clostridia bacterium]
MAGASMNDIKARIKSVESTMQITKAMELVATSKLRRAKEKVERTRPFYEILGKAIDDILSCEGVKDLLVAPKSDKVLYIVVAGDRGLAGGYNANVFRAAEALAKDETALWLPIGKKAMEYYRHRGREIVSTDFEIAADIGVGEAMRIAEMIYEGTLDGRFGKVVIIYTKFVSMMTQTPVIEQLLPLEREASDGAPSPEHDMDPEEMLARIIPAYLGGIIYSALAESVASESGARRSAMNAANKNAAEMIDTLLLKYNRARQAVITQEITEIVSGAEAL